MRFLLLVAIVAAIAGPVAAEDGDFRNGIADILASEEACGLTYDQAALASLISARVAADDIAFTDNVAYLTDLAKYRLDRMTTSARTVHCTQIARLATEFGLTP